METDIYVGNLGPSTTEEALKTTFSAAGSVTGVAIMRSSSNGRPRGFGFVRMSSEEEAANAIQTLNGLEFEGRPLTVGDARERAQRGRDGRRFDEDGGYGSTRTGARRTGGKKRRR